MKKILIPVDFSDVTDLVVENARLIAKSLDAELKIIHVVSSFQKMGEQVAGSADGIFIPPINFESVRDGVATELKNEHKKMFEIKQKLTNEKLKVKTSLLEGTVSAIVLSQLEEYRPDMVIMGSHGHGYMMKALLGSITMFVLKHAKCPVMIVPSKAKKQ